jgi:dipeptidyl aminopeptidase/acylaminoacyl peptidase
MNLTRFPFLAAALLAAAPAPAAAQPAATSPARRPMEPGDILRLRELGAPVVSPDGQWVAYTVTTSDSAADRRNTDIWMVSWDGQRRVQLTSSPDGESSPRWSPDNRYLSFLSSRGDAEKGAQLWLLDRVGGEGLRVTDLRQGIEDYEWAPDGTRLVLVVKDPDPDSAPKGDGKKPPKPIVIDRWDFKRDYQGYLTRRRNHLYLFDLATRSLQQLTTGDMDDRSPAWSPDGQRIAFSSKRAPGAERTLNWDLWVVEARPGATPVQLTTFPGEDDRPVWSPDGRTIAYLQSGDPAYYAYIHDRVAVVPAAGGPARVLTEALDRPASRPHWTPDGRAIRFLLEDDREAHVARVDVASGRVERLTSGQRAFAGLAANGAGRMAALAGTDHEPYEVAAFDGGVARRLTGHNDSLMAAVRTGPVERLTSRSRDGTVVHSLLYLPPWHQPGRRYPLALHIHGGPFAQEQHDFDAMRQIFAARGYAVLTVNYRGSSGRGEAFSKAIYADWGNKEVVDLLGAVDQAVAAGYADPARMVLGGWSYGGILTDAVIATDTRFRAGVSGAGSALFHTMYGTDQYTYQYETELGPPWRTPELWQKVSHPFFNAERIRTPTLFMGGERDFNVPITGSEQMYQALRTLGIDTELVVYPGMFHGPSAPSQRLDILRRYLGWWEKYVPPAVP